MTVGCGTENDKKFESDVAKVRGFDEAVRPEVNSRFFLGRIEYQQPPRHSHDSLYSMSAHFT